MPNGDIALANESSGTGYEPVQTEKIFFEGFEGNLLVNIQDDNWKLVSNPTDPTIHVNYPLAYEGNNSLQLSAAKSMFEAKYGNIDFSFNPINDTGKMTLSFYFSSKGLNKSSNTITIKYKIQGQEEWQQHSLESTRNTIWENYSLVFPNQIIPTINIDGTAVPGSTLAIDNIEVVQEVSNIETSINGSLPHNRSENKNELYYTLDGRRLSSPQQGINILRMPDGTYKKVFVH